MEPTHTEIEAGETPEHLTKRIGDLYNQVAVLSSFRNRALVVLRHCQSFLISQRECYRTKKEIDKLLTEDIVAAVAALDALTPSSFRIRVLVGDKRSMEFSCTGSPDDDANLAEALQSAASLLLSKSVPDTELW